MIQQKLRKQGNSYVGARSRRMLSSDSIYGQGCCSSWMCNQRTVVVPVLSPDMREGSEGLGAENEAGATARLRGSRWRRFGISVLPRSSPSMPPSWSARALRPRRWFRKGCSNPRSGARLGIELYAEEDLDLATLGPF